MKWSGEVVRMGNEEENGNAKGRESKALPPTPVQDRENNASSSRSNSLLRRVSVLLGRARSGRRQGRGGREGSTHQHPKPDPLWQARTGSSAPGLWEMSVLPSQRLTQYRYLLRELLATVPPAHPWFADLERASQGIVFISEKVARVQEGSAV